MASRLCARLVAQHGRRRLCTKPNPNPKPKADPAVQTYNLGLGLNVQEPFHEPITKFAGVKTEGAKIENVCKAAWNGLGLLVAASFWLWVCSEALGQRSERQRCCCGAKH